MGFCLVNHVAVAARHLQATGRARRVAIVDWDVHHGNGTQEIFYDDPSVYYLSLHQSPLFPGTGSASERGAGPGEGTTRNVPLPPGTDGPALAGALDRALEAAAAEFTPDFILVSAGFDALRGDPLGGFRLEPSDFHVLTRRILHWADAACRGQVVAVLEGGYDPGVRGRPPWPRCGPWPDSPTPSNLEPSPNPGDLPVRYRSLRTPDFRILACRTCARGTPMPSEPPSSPSSRSFSWSPPSVPRFRKAWTGPSARIPRPTRPFPASSPPSVRGSCCPSVPRPSPWHSGIPSRCWPCRGGMPTPWRPGCWGTTGRNTGRCRSGAGRASWPGSSPRWPS
jgi:hypothetical protein